MAIKVVTGACGSGKTRWALARALENVRNGGTTLYVSPTRALSSQFAQWMEKEGVPVTLAFGRRLGENCLSPLVDIALAFRESASLVCDQCPHRRRCTYLQAKAAMVNWSTPVVVTTLHFLSMLSATIVSPTLVIYDDIDPILSIPKRFRATVYADAVYEEAGKKNGFCHYVPQLVYGRDETLLLSATPITEFWKGEPERYTVDDSPYPLRQTVLVHLMHLSHSSPWVPPLNGCGFKKNTAQGLPYFLASIGLNDWRGIGLQVAGTFQPPFERLGILAALLTKVWHERYTVVFLPIEMLAYGRNRNKVERIPSAMFVIKNHRVILPPSCVGIYPLVQLLGRAGVGVTNTYLGDLPLWFTYHEGGQTQEVQLAERIYWQSTPQPAVKFHQMRHQVGRVLSGEIPERRLTGDEKKYLGLVRRILETTNRIPMGVYDG